MSDVADVAFESSYMYTPVLAARIARRELFKRHRRFLVILALAFFWSLLCLRSSALSWLSGFLMGVSSAFVLILLRWYLSAIATASVYSDAPISIHLDLAGVRLSSSVINSECPWGSVAAVHRIPEGLLLIRRGAQQAVPLPFEALPTGAAAFVVSAVRNAGGRIEDGA